MDKFFDKVILQYILKYILEYIPRNWKGKILIIGIVIMNKKKKEQKNHWVFSTDSNFLMFATWWFEPLIFEPWIIWSYSSYSSEVSFVYR